MGTRGSQPAGRVLVITLAEATMDLIGPWAAEGRLPAIRALMETGAHGRLRSQVPLITPQLWGTIVTGRSPGHHGVFDFWQRGADGRFREVNGSKLRERPIWSLLSDRDVPSAILNVPFTFPPTPIEGFMISGEDAPGAHRSIAQPPEVYDEVVSRFGRYRLKDVFPGGRRKSDYLTLIPEDVEKQTDAFAHLLRSREWEFGIVFYSATAIAQHYFWADMSSDDPDDPYRSVVENAYKAVDRAIGRLVDAAGPETTVFVISECGAGPIRSGVQINTVLEQNGFLKRRKQSARSGGSRSLVDRVRTAAQGTLNRFQLDSLYYWANRMGALKSWVQAYLSRSDIDWSGTRAFSHGKEGDIFVNLAGREPHGTVAPGTEYERVRDEIVAAFEGLVDPGTGERAVTRVHRREELFSGPMLEWAPDLIIEWRDCAYMPTESERDKESVFVERWRRHMDWPTSGAHRVDGVLVASGPGIRQAAEIQGARLIDLMPTWLACLGVPVPDALEGQVLAQLLTKTQRADPGVAAAASART
jgi:predicted AlkP superfamily phosphohydrolase/phosphomutase